MNKIEQMHLDVIKQSYHSYRLDEEDASVVEEVFLENRAAVKCAEITEQVAIEFAEWCNKPSSEDLRQGNVVYVPSGNFYWHNHKKYTPKELFQEFLKTKQ